MIRNLSVKLQPIHKRPVKYSIVYNGKWWDGKDFTSKQPTHIFGRFQTALNEQIKIGKGEVKKIIQ